MFTPLWVKLPAAVIFLDAVKLLVKLGADVNLSDTTGKGGGVLSSIVGLHCYRNICKRKEMSTNSSMVQLILNAGCDLNKKYRPFTETAFQKLTLSPDHLLHMLMLILATRATTTDLSQVYPKLQEYRNTKKVDLIEQLFPKKLNLKSTCRKVIRDHLLAIDPHKNLFCVVQLLTLPLVLVDYLMFNTFLEEEKDGQRIDKK